jgi:hypothetical protein
LANRGSDVVIVDFRPEDARIIRVIAIVAVGVVVAVGLLFAVLSVVLA